MHGYIGPGFSLPTPRSRSTSDIGMSRTRAHVRGPRHLSTRSTPAGAGSVASPCVGRLPGGRSLRHAGAVAGAALGRVAGRREVPMAVRLYVGNLPYSV